jgi:hypothetical protein
MMNSSKFIGSTEEARGVLWSTDWRSWAIPLGAGFSSLWAARLLRTEKNVSQCVERKKKRRKKKE